ncbi:hypothetical protein AX16_007507 [Volvariella volvacea WC 439]|nr:hypothetical protein AX16_007507 [Volvariella volvacea WC 439]
MVVMLFVLLTLGLLQCHRASARAVYERFRAVEEPSDRQHAFAYPAFVHGQDTDLDNWNLTVRPAENTTANFIFETVSSLLQHWPGMRYRNGHTIVPGMIPPGTLLFHGTSQPKVPTIPEWTATNPEFSHNFCRTHADVEGCWHLTLVAVRPLRILYFDGNSAAKLDNGPVDSQDILLWGKAKPEWVFEERRRLEELCGWGKKFKIDGFVRLSADFEVMLCDFTAGLEVVSFLNLVKEGLPWGWDPNNLSLDGILDHDFAPPSFGPSTPEMKITMRPPDMQKIKMIEASSWIRSYPGEMRVQLDVSRLVSFYDAELFSSLVPTRVGQERWDHRVAGISPSDAQTLVQAVEESLEGELMEPRPHGIDWQAQFQVIVNRFAGRIEMLQYVLNGTTAEVGNGYEELDHMRIIQRAIHEIKVMLNSYTLHYLAPPTSVIRDEEHSWARPVFKYCSTTYTKGIRLATERSGVELTRGEKLMLDALEGTNREICRVLVNLWAEGVEMGLDDRSAPLRSTEHDEQQVEGLVLRWRQEVGELMKWLDWSQWFKCRPACGPEEICYLPTWPWLVNVKLPNHRNDTSTPPEDAPDSEERPMPQCIRRLDPYTW